MRPPLRLSLAPAFFTGYLLWGIGAQAASATAGAGATVVDPVAVMSERSLDFGLIVPGSAAGSITLSPDGSRSFAGGIGGMESRAGEVGLFIIKGAADASYSVALPPTVVLTQSGGIDQMALNFWTRSSRAEAGSGKAEGRSLAVGGTLHVGAHQAPGLYSGVFDIRFEYD